MDLLPYLRGDGRVYAMRGTWHGGVEVTYTQRVTNPRWYHVKNRLWEEFWLGTDGFIWRGTDTSPGGNELYTNFTGAQYGARWLPRHMTPGQTINIAPEVVFRDKTTGQPVPGKPRYTHHAWLRFVRHTSQWLTPFGVSVSDVIELEGGIPGMTWDERYYYARDHGLVGWAKNNAEQWRSGIAEYLHPSAAQPREHIPWLALPNLPPVNMEPDMSFILPEYPGPGWQEAVIRSTASGTNVRASVPNGNVVGVVPRTPITTTWLHREERNHNNDGNRWAAILWNGAPRWVAMRFIDVIEWIAEPEPEPEPPLGGRYAVDLGAFTAFYDTLDDLNTSREMLEAFAQRFREYSVIDDSGAPGDGGGGNVLASFAGRDIVAHAINGKTVELPAGYYDRQKLVGDRGPITLDGFWVIERPEPGTRLNVDSVSGNRDIAIDVDHAGGVLTVEGRFYNDAALAPDHSSSSALRNAYVFVHAAGAPADTADIFVMPSFDTNPKDVLQVLTRSWYKPAGRYTMGIGFYMEFGVLRGGVIVTDVVVRA